MGFWRYDTLGRYDALKEVLAGYQQTGIPLIAYDGTQLLPFTSPDDPGLYYLIPHIAYWCHMSLDTALAYTYGSFVWGAVVLGTLGFFLLFRSWITRILSLITLTGIALWPLKKAAMYYHVYACAPMATIPLFLYFTRKKHSSRLFYIFLFLSGVFLGFCHYFRSHAATAPFILMSIILLGSTTSAWKKKVLLYTTLCAGLFVPYVSIAMLNTQHHRYVEKQFPGHVFQKTRHPFWHSVYCGLGILHPLLYDFEPKLYWDDSCWFNKAKMHVNCSQSYQSPEIEACLKDAVIEICTTQPQFVLYTLAAKAGIIFLFFLIFAHIGIIAAILYPKGWLIEGAFFCALGFASLYGFLTLPTVIAYMLGFITLSTLYGLISIGYALEQ